MSEFDLACELEDVGFDLEEIIAAFRLAAKNLDWIQDRLSDLEKQQDELAESEEESTAENGAEGQPEQAAQAILREAKKEYRKLKRLYHDEWQLDPRGFRDTFVTAFLREFETDIPKEAKS